MIEIKGEFFEEAENKQYSHDSEDIKYDGLVCTTNTTLKSDGDLVMGKGIALAFAEKYKFLPSEWGRRVKSGHRSVMVSPKTTDMSGGYLIALPTKYDWKKPSPEWLVIQSCKEMLFIVNCLGLQGILMTRPGCGNGGLNWDNIKPKLEFLDDRFKVISNE